MQLNGKDIDYERIWKMIENALIESKRESNLELITVKETPIELLILSVN